MTRSLNTLRAPARCLMSGMTLTEALVSLALLSMLSAGMFGTFRVVQRAYGKIAEADRSHWDVAVSQRFVRNIVEGAYPFEQDSGSVVRAVGLEGAEDRLSVTAPGTLAANSSGFRRYALFVAPRADGTADLMVTSQLDRNGASTEARGSSPEILIARVQKVKWSYFDSADGVWKSRWGHQFLPASVKLRVEFPAGDSRHWPELIVSPRIDDDANCSFDAVSQSCRQARS